MRDVAGYVARLLMAIAAVLVCASPSVAQTSYVRAGHLIDVEAGVVKRDQIVRMPISLHFANA